MTTGGAPPPIVSRGVPLRVSLRWSADDVRTVGRLAIAPGRGRRIFCELDPEFLQSPLPISPLRLAPRAGVIEGPAEPFVWADRPLANAQKHWCAAAPMTAISCMVPQ
jgi:hypothetical protein